MIYVVTGERKVPGGTGATACRRVAGKKIEDVAGIRDKEGKKQVMMIELEGREAGVEEAIAGTEMSRFGAKACLT